MSRKKNNRGQHYKPPNPSGPPKPVALLPSAPESKTDLYGLVVGVLFGFFLAVVFVPDSALTLYFAWVCFAAILFLSIYKFSRRSRLVNGALVFIGLAVIALIAFYQTRERLRPSFLYVVPGVEIFGPQHAWTFHPKPKGPKTIFNAQITLTDVDGHNEVTRGKQELSVADINSYMTILRYPEVSKHNLNALSHRLLWSRRIISTIPISLQTSLGVTAGFTKNSRLQKFRANGTSKCL